MALLEIDNKLLQAAIRAFLNETGLLLRVRDERLEIGGNRLMQQSKCQSTGASWPWQLNAGPRTRISGR